MTPLTLQCSFKLFKSLSLSNIVNQKRQIKFNKQKASEATKQQGIVAINFGGFSPVKIPPTYSFPPGTTYRQVHPPSPRYKEMWKILDKKSRQSCYSGPQIITTLHYWLRGSMGFEKYYKWTKVDTYFSYNKTQQTRNFALFEMLMTQILHKKIFTIFFENKFGQN